MAGTTGFQQDVKGARERRAHRTIVAHAARIVNSLLFDRRYFWHYATLLLLAQLVLGTLAIRYVKYTEIDWMAYMEQVEMFKAGERHYANIRGGTGPLVYPALHLYIYTLLNNYLSSDPSWAIRSAQYFFLAIWTLTFCEASAILYLAGARTTRRLPQALLTMLVLSKRTLSIYLLRLFNDPLAMVLLYAAVLVFMGAQRRGGGQATSLWRLGSVLFSLALGVKMNILLFVPGLLVVLVQLRGVMGTLESLIIIAAVQVLLPAPFFLSSTAHATSYFTSAFDFSRQFLYVWTVNWRLLPEKVFLSKTFGTGLLAAQLGLLLAFALLKWSPARSGGSIGILQKALLGGPRAWITAPMRTTEVSATHIPLVLFTSNLIGVTFARSLHYQFYSWYFHQLPLLMGLAVECVNPWATLVLAAAQFLTIESMWNQYPSTTLSSLTLLFSHLNLLRSLWRLSEEPGNQASKHVD